MGKTVYSRNPSGSKGNIVYDFSGKNFRKRPSSSL